MLLLSYPDDNIPTLATAFIYNGAFDIIRSVRNVLGCTLLFDVNYHAINPQILHIAILTIN